jgi:hypothetical protein
MAGNQKSRRAADDGTAGMRRREFWCTCPAGHRFAASLYAAIDLDAQPEAIELLSDTGLQPARCAQCEVELWLAEPFLLHQPGRRRSALFVPDAVSHRELELHAEALSAIAAAPEPGAPHTADPQVVIGVAALQKWLFGETAEPSRADTKPPAARASKAPREIHAAFADLDDAERPSNRPSMPPVGPQMDGVDVNEPLLDEDWLADEAIAPSRQKGGGRRGERGQGETAIARTVRRRSSGVDFAGLLADDDADPPAERAGVKKQKERGDG